MDRQRRSGDQGGGGGGRAQNDKDNKQQQQRGQPPPQQHPPPPPRPANEESTSENWLFTWDRALNPRSNSRAAPAAPPPPRTSPSQAPDPPAARSDNNNLNHEYEDANAPPPGGLAEDSLGPVGPSGAWDGKSTTSESHFYDAESNLFPPRDEDALAAALQQRNQRSSSANIGSSVDAMDLGMIGGRGGGGNGGDDDEEDDDEDDAARRETEFMLGLQGKSTAHVASAAAAAAAAAAATSAAAAAAADSHDAYLTRVALNSEARRQKRRRQLAGILFIFLVVPMAVLFLVLSLRPKPPRPIPLVDESYLNETSTPTLSMIPSASPSEMPSGFPTSPRPSTTPSYEPTPYPTVSNRPTLTPSVSAAPSPVPSPYPTRAPVFPSAQPSVRPSSQAPTPNRVDCSALLLTNQESQQPPPPQDADGNILARLDPLLFDPSNDMNISQSVWSIQSYLDVQFWTSAVGTLCMLVQTDGTSLWIPVARSYEGHVWESYRTMGNGGASSLEHISCTKVENEEGTEKGNEGSDSDDEEVLRYKARYCTLRLPAPEDKTLYYAVAPRSFKMSSQLAHLDLEKTRDNAYARFLEQATMGTMSSDLVFLNSHYWQLQQDRKDDDNQNLTPRLTDPVLIAWMKLQMEVVSPSFHRVFWRKHATTRYSASSIVGQVTHPCQAHAAYRNFAFINQHEGEFLQISSSSSKDDQSTTFKFLSINNAVYTMVDGPIQFQKDDVSGKMPLEFPDGLYKFCRAPESFLNGKVYLEHPDEKDCSRSVLFGTSGQGNPLVHFDEKMGLPQVPVELPVDLMIPMDESYYASKGQARQRLLLAQKLSDPACPPEQKGGGEVPFVLGRIERLETNLTEYWIHDPRFVLLENTLEDPLPDGGSSVVTQTVIDRTKVKTGQAFCPNVGRSFQNEATCRLSALPLHIACSYNGGREVVCGSPGEVANDLTSHGERNRGAFDLIFVHDDDDDSYHPFDITTKPDSTTTSTLQDSQTVWMSIALTAPDQLRQRTAWALSQMIVANVYASAGLRPESLVHFYDIFVRSAFGNYRTILKEVVYSPVMASMLNSLHSRSLGFNWRSFMDGGLIYPDETFARIMMQLFTVGKYELDDCGSYKLDDRGRLVPTYSSDVIKEYARVWTGFQENHVRGNKDDPMTNQIDPMDIEPLWRDVFPKMGLSQRYVGDGYPLCADRPNQHFLKRGAKYILLGEKSLSDLQTDPREWAHDETAVRFVADPSGQLNAMLCGATGGDPNCWYPPVVTLRDNIQCFGAECEVETIRVVQVEGGIFYEYVPLPCVHQTYFDKAQVIKKKFLLNGQGTAYMCADPRTAVASTACCFDGALANVHEQHYWGERVKASEAGEICSTASGEAYCTTGQLSIQNCVGTSCVGDYYFWMSPFAPCRLKAKIDTDGRIAIVHELPEENDEDRERGYEEEDNKTFFRVQYFNGGDQVNNLISNCDINTGCSTSSDGYCMCDVSVSSEQIFTNFPTSKEEVLATLRIGSFSPDVLDGSYTNVTVGSMTMHMLDGALSDQTIFEIVDDFGAVHLLKNYLSVVRIGTTDIVFRNPVQFMSLAEPTRRDAQFEIDAAIDQLFYHKNTAPFVAMHLAQRFGISNPSRRYVKSITEAFRQGTYFYQDGASSVTFGEGSYGDLKAAVAATLLDREARSLVLDADPVHGSLKEPLLTLTGLMRNLQYQPTPNFPYPRFFKDMQATIGQMVYQAPSSFSFFDPRFQPEGPIKTAGLVSPEAETYSGFNVIGTMNGFLAMIKYGLDRCFDGFGETSNWEGDEGCHTRVAGKYVNMSSKPVFVPDDASSPTSIVDDLATLMTSGRLSAEHREVIKGVLSNEVDPLLGIVKAEQLIASSAVFHSTGTINSRTQGKPAHIISKTSQPENSYKALVVLMLTGGCDSYNLLVPHTCKRKNDKNSSVLDQYIAQRAEVALNASERKLAIDVKGQRQPCEKFAVHNKLPVLQDLYIKGDLCFFLNAGMINKLADRKTWRAMTSTELFDNYSMRKEAQQVDPYSQDAPTGVLARLSHVLNSKAYGYRAQTLAINKLTFAVKGNTTNAFPPIILDEHGPQKFNDKPETEMFDPLPIIKQLNEVNGLSNSFFGNFWSESLMRALTENERLSNAFNSAALMDDTCGSGALNTVVRFMETRNARGHDRDLIYVEMGGWDHRSYTKERLAESFGQLNQDIKCFMGNTQNKGLWENVTVLVLSENGRTLEPSDEKEGTDVGWAGHYFAFGGAVKGGKVFGEYPRNLTEGAPLNAAKGIMIPTLSWESIWFAVSEWIGVTSEADLDNIFPNGKGTGTTLLRKEDVFEAGL